MKREWECVIDKEFYVEVVHLVLQDRSSPGLVWRSVWSHTRVILLSFPNGLIQYVEVFGHFSLGRLDRGTCEEPMVGGINRRSLQGIRDCIILPFLIFNGEGELLQPECPSVSEC